MSARYTQSKAETQRHLEILKGMLKRPENKLCADCKRNDPRWASTNLGCFMCIRCSGIHRGMGVHITRIKSVDLDTWTPEQIANIQRWGNKRANKYWEAHLKEGHLPAEHKMESFIRSKYELKRWAMEGPPPDPETLDDDASATAPEPVAATRSSSTSSRKAPASTPQVDLFSGPPSSSSASTARRAQPQAKSTPAAPATTGSLFDLDFDSPAVSTSSSAPAPPSQQSTPTPQQQQRNAAVPPAVAAPPKRDAKADILSLFSSAPPPRPPQQQQQQPAHHASQGSIGGVTSGLGGLNFGDSGGGGWGTSAMAPPVPSVHHQNNSPNGFGDFSSSASTPSYQQSSVPSYNSPAPSNSHSNDLFSTSSSSIWGNTSTNPPPSTASATKANDPFAEFGAFNGGGGGNHNDIWGGSSSSSTNKANTTSSSSGGGFSDIWS